jgi:hypothetical protein
MGKRKAQRNRLRGLCLTRVMGSYRFSSLLMTDGYAPTHLVREVFHAHLRRRDAHCLQQLRHALAQSAAAQ